MHSTSADGGQGRNRTADASLFMAVVGQSHRIDSVLLSYTNRIDFGPHWLDQYWNQNLMGSPKFRLTMVSRVHKSQMNALGPSDVKRFRIIELSHDDPTQSWIAFRDERLRAGEATWLLRLKNFQALW